MTVGVYTHFAVEQLIELFTRLRVAEVLLLGFFQRGYTLNFQERPFPARVILASRWGEVEMLAARRWMATTRSSRNLAVYLGLWV